MTEHMTKERKEEIRQKVSIRDTSILRFYEMIELLNELDYLETNLKKTERKIKSFCKNDCDGGKEMDLCGVCSLGSLLDAPKKQTIEIIGVDGNVHYRRPEGDPLIKEALQKGLTVKPEEPSKPSNDTTDWPKCPRCNGPVNSAWKSNMGQFGVEVCASCHLKEIEDKKTKNEESKTNARPNN